MTATTTQPSVGPSRISESASGTPPFQALTTSSVAAPPGRSRLSRVRSSVPVIPTQLVTATTPRLRGSEVTCACSGELVTPAVASPRASIITNVATTPSTRSATSAGPSLRPANTPRITATCTAEMTLTGSTRPVRMAASPAAVERSRLRNRSWRRAASVVTVVA